MSAAIRFLGTLLILYVVAWVITLIAGVPLWGILAWTLRYIGTAVCMLLMLAFGLFLTTDGGDLAGRNFHRWLAARAALREQEAKRQAKEAAEVDKLLAQEGVSLT